MKRVISVIASLCVLGAAGCGGDARVELAAADALLVVADELELALGEYQNDAAGLDDQREAEVVEAFIARVQLDHEDEAALGVHSEAFRQALQRIRADRSTAWRRYDSSMANVDVMREVARGLQKLGVASLTLHDEMQRYLISWIETRRAARQTSVGQINP